MLSRTTTIRLVSGFPRPISPGRLALRKTAQVRYVSELEAIMRPFLLRLRLRTLFSLLVHQKCIKHGPVSPTAIQRLRSLSKTRHCRSTFGSATRAFAIINLDNVNGSATLRTVLDLCPRAVHRRHCRKGRFIRARVA